MIRRFSTGFGTHSNRKFSSTRSRRSGATKDERDYRGRWKRNRRTSDAYDDAELPYPDAKVASLLCVGGPCSYRIKEGSAITDAWILEHVVPRITALYGETLAKLLGKALLWTIFSEKSGWVSAAIVDRVKGAYNNIAGANAGDENRIEKRLLVVTGNDATLYINEVVPTNQNQNQQQQQAGQQEQGQQVAGHLEGHTNQQLLHTLLNQVNQLQSSVTQITEARAADRVMLAGQFGTINANIRRILAAQPIRALNAQQNNNGGGGGGGAGGGAGGVANPLVLAELSPTPRTLYVLWQEYQIGIAGRKAARLFTREERGRVKHKYHRRKVVWDLVSRLINSGLTAQVACDRIYNVYGDDKTVTYIINKLKADSRNNALHVTLQV